MNWCWRKILVMPVLTCFFSTSISDNTKFSEMKPGERTKAYKISSVKYFCREKGPIEHEDMATRTHSISFWTDQNFPFSVSLNPYLAFTFKVSPCPNVQMCPLKTLPEAQRTQKLTPRLGLNLATTCIALALIVILATRWRHLTFSH